MVWLYPVRNLKAMAVIAQGPFPILFILELYPIELRQEKTTVRGHWWSLYPKIWLIFLLTESEPGNSMDHGWTTSVSPYICLLKVRMTWKHQF